MDNNVIGLYEHNAKAYEKVKSSYEEGEQIVGIVHATGTGKSYIALQLAYDNQDKDIVYVVPTVGIIEHLKKVIEENPNLSLSKDFSHIQFRTYQSFVNSSREELENLKCDLLILDEFHHIGAPIWGARINDILENHPDSQVLGMTAYTVRDRGTSYERDMADPETDEVFSRKIVSRYDLCDAMIEGVLPKPIYKSAYVNLTGLESILEQKVENLVATDKEYQKYKSILRDIKKRISEAPSIADVVRKNLKPDGKYIYFCPAVSEEGTNDIDTIMKEAKSWFQGYFNEEDIVFYKTTSEMGEDGRKNREAFYFDQTLAGEDASKKLRLMFAINQYNEGVHAPNIDGVIMGRGTSSDIVYFEQLGRALAVRGDTKDKSETYEKYSKEQLLTLAKEKDIIVDDGISKEEIIEKLISPVIIDLTNNYEFIKDLENNLKDRIKLMQGPSIGEKRTFRLRDASFDIEIENKDLYEMLDYLRDRLNPERWQEMYELAKSYYEYHKDLEIPSRFKTNDGYEYDTNGRALGEWISTQRKLFAKDRMLEDRKKMLEEIGMRFETNKFEIEWQEMYELAKSYYEYHKDLEIPSRFKTNNGYEFDENGKALGKWIDTQRMSFAKGRMPEDRKELLKGIEMRFETKDLEKEWQKMYELAKSYYEHYDDLEVPQSFKTSNGYESDENGKALGRWIHKQRILFAKGKIQKDRKELLEGIEMHFETKDLEKEWQEMYELAKSYYEHYDDLEIPAKFKTSNGYEYDKNGKALGKWIYTQRTSFVKGTIPEDRKELLERIGMRFETNKLEIEWQKMYELAKSYYEHYDDLEVPKKFKTNNGYESDENGKALGQWISRQRTSFAKGKMPEDRKELLEEVGMRFGTKNLEKEWQKMYELAKSYYKHYENLEIPSGFRTNNGYESDENGKALGQWISRQRVFFANGTIPEDRKELLEEVGMRFETKDLEKEWQKMYELAKSYYEHYDDLEVPQSFKTNNGYEFDENGRTLGTWIDTQRMSFAKGRMPEDRKELLKGIGMRFETKDLEKEWQKMYELAKSYYEHYDDLEVPQSFKTNNGYEFDENGRTLGKWISSQRMSFVKGRMPEDRKELLEEVGMRFETRKQQEKKKELCLTYHISGEENDKIVSHISYQELDAKVNYLLSNNIPVTTTDSKLHEIFTMSSKNIEEKYGINLEQMVEQYATKQEKEKGK